MIYILLILFNFAITVITASFICKYFMERIVEQTKIMWNEYEKQIFDMLDKKIK